MSEIINKISNLTTKQQEYLVDFLESPEMYVGGNKDDIVVLAELLRNLRSTKAYKRKLVRNSTERSIYFKYIKAQEKQMELELYSLLRRFKVQLRKGGYDSSTCLKEELGLTDEDKEIIDSIFPENVNSQTVQEIPYPEFLATMDEKDLIERDMESTARARSLRVENPAYDGNPVPAREEFALSKELNDLIEALQKFEKRVP
jgi:hypothetical protein